MNVRLHSFSIKNIFYDKMDLRTFYFDVAKWMVPKVISQRASYGYVLKLMLMHQFHCFYAENLS